MHKVGRSPQKTPYRGKRKGEPRYFWKDNHVINGTFPLVPFQSVHFKFSKIFKPWDSTWCRVWHQTWRRAVMPKVPLPKRLLLDESSIYILLPLDWISSKVCILIMKNLNQNPCYIINENGSRIQIIMLSYSNPWKHVRSRKIKESKWRPAWSVALETDL